MAIVTTDDRHYRDIAEAIRTKFGTTDQYKPEEMAPAVMNLDSYEEYLGEITGFGTLENTSWTDIKAVGASGGAENYWAVGDTKSVVLNGTVGIVNLVHQTYLFCIIGFNHNENYEGKGIHFMLEKTIEGTNIALTDSNHTNATSSVSFRYNLSDVNTGGWQGCYLRNTICQSFYEALPSDLKSVLDGCIKYTDNVGGTSMAAANVTATNDKIFIPAEFEIFGVKTGANNAEQNYQKQYDYYKAGNSKVKYCSHNLGEQANWWLRSPDNNGSYALGVAVSKISGFRATNSLGLVPCFKVG